MNRLPKPAATFAAALAAIVSFPALAAHSDAARPYDGIWRSQGYGWVWKVENAEVARFDVGPGFCIPKAASETPRIAAKDVVTLSRDHSVLKLRQQDPDYVYTFERLERLPVPCGAAPLASDARTALETLIAMFSTHYAFFEQRGVDWPKLSAAARTKVTDKTGEERLFAILEETLLPFGESHVRVEAEIDGHDELILATDNRPRREPPGPSPVSGSWNHKAAEAALGRALKRAGDLKYGLFPNGVGYLQIPTMYEMKDAELDAALDRAIGALKKAGAVIVDVSMNDGGRDSYARRIAARFTDRPVIAYSKYAGDFAGAKPQAIVVQPAKGPRYSGPVWLVTGKDTVSAAEVFALAMRALPNVTHIGQTTDGSLSDELWKTLPNGWVISMSNEIYLDSEGKLWEGVGVQPEIPMAIADRPASRQDRKTVRDVVEFIAGRVN